MAKPQKQREQRQEKTETTYDKIKRWLDNAAMREVLIKTLPRSVAVDPWIQVALQRIRLDSKLMQAESLSTMGCIMSVAGLGLRLDGPLGQAYLTTRAVHRKTDDGQWIFSHYECQMQIGYKGLIDLVLRNPDVADVESVIVHDADEFNFRRGSEPFLNHTYDHRLTEEDRGDMVSLYTGLRFKSGYYSFEIYPIYNVLKTRERALANQGITIDRTTDEPRYLKKSYGGDLYEMNPDQIDKTPWIAHEIPMVKKTGVRWSATYWQLSPDLAQAAALVELEERGVSQRMADVANTMLPNNIRAQAESDVPNQGKTAPAQVRSLASATDLASRMAAEAGVKSDKPAEPEKGQQEPAQEPPAAKEPEPKEPTEAGAKSQTAEPNEQEKAEILAQEEAEAAEFEANQQKELGLKGKKKRGK